MDVAVIGTGLIGTSIGLAAMRALGGRVRAFDADPEALAAAAGRGLEPVGVIEEAASASELTFVCTPVPAIVPAAVQALRSTGAVVTDAGSVKASVLEDLAAQEADQARFVGGHPLTGSERTGAAAASPVLLDGAVWALTPTGSTDPAAVELVEDTVRRMGADPVRLEPHRHDAIVAMVSHLPQLVSTALMQTAAGRASQEPGLLLLAAGGFRDLTRLAASGPELWADILLENRGPIAEAVAAMEAGLDDLLGMIEAGDRAGILEAFREAKSARLALAAKPQARLGVAILAIPIPDRPGALAGITGVLAERGVNIEDIEIVHTAEGARGTVHLTVSEGDADDAIEALISATHQVVRLA